MKRFLFLILFFIGIGESQILTVTEGPMKICGTPQIDAEKIRVQLDSLRQANPAEYERIMERAREIEAFNRKSPQDQIFYAYNFKINSHYEVVARLHRTGNLTKIWVENDSWDKGYVNDTILDELLQNLEVHSGSNSIDPNRGIIELDTLMFGQPPDVDGDGYVHFLILDIQDSFDSTQSSSSFVAGYFYSRDQTNQTFSNHKDMLYLDSYPAIYYQGNLRTDRVLSTTAHEFQHLIHYRYDPNEADWVNEGLSELAGTYCGYGLDFPNLYLSETNVSLTSWSGEVKDYSRVNLWTLYCAEQFGLTFIKQLTQNPLQSIEGFNQALTLSGYSETLQSIFPDWILANLINDHSFDFRLGYQWQEAQNLHAGMSEIISEYPDNFTKTGIIKDYGAEYHQFLGEDSLQIQFSGNLPETYWVVSKNNDYRIVAFPGTEISEPDFSLDSTYVLVLYSTIGEANYSYSASAVQSIQRYEMSYDDGVAEWNIQFTGIAANRFVVPEEKLILYKVRFWTSAENFQARIRLYLPSYTGMPGSEIISPIDTMVSYGKTWIDVSIPEQLILNKNEIVFAGVEISSSQKSLGFDISSPDDQSYLNVGSGWAKVSAYQTNTGDPLNGDWMIRAVFLKLVSSDSIPLQGIEPTFVLHGSYPNPFTVRGNSVTFRFGISEAGVIRLVIYNILGQRVFEEEQTYSNPGDNLEIRWDGEGRNGELPSGIYFYQLRYYNPSLGTEFHSENRKIVLIK